LGKRVKWGVKEKNHPPPPPPPPPTSYEACLFTRIAYKEKEVLMGGGVLVKENGNGNSRNTEA